MEDIYEELELLQPTSNIQLNKWLLFNNILNCEVIVNFKKPKKNFAISLLPSPPHWVLLDEINKKVFDSFGSGPGVFYYDKYLTNYEPYFPYNIYQGYNTAVCGEYCCLFLKYNSIFNTIFLPSTATKETWKTAAEIPMNQSRILNDRMCISLWWTQIENIDVKNFIRKKFDE